MSTLFSNHQRIPKLQGNTNYQAWKLTCTSALESAGVWDFVVGTVPDPVKDDDERPHVFRERRRLHKSLAAQARHIILSSCKSHIQLTLARVSTAKQCWEKLNSDYSADTTTSENEKRWYEALFEEDCVPLMKLLEEDPRLLKVGWESDFSRQVEGSPRHHWEPRTQKPWMGRTALHVAARRGCVKLVKQILILYDLKEILKLDLLDSDSHLHSSGASPPHTTEGQYGPNFKYVLVKLDSGRATRGIASGDERDESTMEVDTISSPGEPTQGQNDATSDSGNYQPIQESGHTPQETKSMATTSESRMDKTIEMARRTVAHWKSHAKRRKSKNKLETTSADLITGEGLRDPRRTMAHLESQAQLTSSELVALKELRNLLLSRDGEYGVDALAMATINGNMDLVNLLVYALGKCEDSPYSIKEMAFERRLYEDEKAYKSNLSKLEEVIQRVMILEFPRDDSGSEMCLEDYDKHRDFNFLKKEEYLFHFLSSHRKLEETVVSSRWSDATPIFDDSKERNIYQFFYTALLKHVVKEGKEFLRFLLSFQDGQGRPPFHVAIDEGRGSILLSFMSGNIYLQNLAMTPLDGSGRTSLHRATATGDCAAMKCLMKIGMFDREVGDMFKTSYTHRSNRNISYSGLSVEHGFRKWSLSTVPIQEAIIHKQARCAGMAYKFLAWKREREQEWERRSSLMYEYYDEDFRPRLDVMELACFVPDNFEVVNELLKAKCRPTRLSSIAALHLAAASANYKILELFVDDDEVDTFTEDKEGNTALHYALNRDLVTMRFKTHLLDYVSCQHLLSSDQREVKRISKSNLLEERQKFVSSLLLAVPGENHLEERQVAVTSFWQGLWYRHLLSTDERQIKETAGDVRLEERQGCVDLLLQAGCDIFRTNLEKKAPYPRGTLRENGKFLSWWHEKQGKEFSAIQSGLSTAANAISVTAVLVATASYVGPLQPPLGLGTGGSTTDQMQYDNVWVATFIFSDTLSFYLAIVSIILSLIPNLPMPQQAMVDELRRTRVMVALAVIVLFLSIICILIAFASSSLAVVGQKLLSGLGGQLTIATLCFGGFLVALAFLLFSVRLLGFFFPKSSWIRSLYKATSFDLHPWIGSLCKLSWDIGIVKVWSDDWSPALCCWCKGSNTRSLTIPTFSDQGTSDYEDVWFPRSAVNSDQGSSDNESRLHARTRSSTRTVVNSDWGPQTAASSDKELDKDSYQLGQ